MATENDNAKSQEGLPDFNQEQYDLLVQCAKDYNIQKWNTYRAKHTKVRIHLQHADLSGADLLGANLLGADLREAYLVEADLLGANLSGANLLGVDLREANLIGANLQRANLWAANLDRAYLSGADLGGATDDKLLKSTSPLTKCLILCHLC